jgi:virginiamycin B lyase
MRALVCASMVAGLVACAGTTEQIHLWPPKTPAVVPGQRIEFKGLSVLPPQHPGWVVMPPLPQPPRPVNTLVSFSNTFGKPGVQQVVAGVLLIDIGRQTFDSPQAFEEFNRVEMNATLPVIMTARRKLLSLDIGPASLPGLMCVRYDAKAEETGGPSSPGGRFLFSVHGYRCLDPKWPRYAVDLNLFQRYPDSAKPLDLSAQVEPFLQSLAFTEERPLAVTTIEVGSGPQQLVAAAGSIWVAYGDHGVARIDPKTNTVSAQIVVGRDPIGIAFAGGSIWSADRQDGTLSRIDPATNKVVATVKVGGKPLMLATCAGSLWVADQASGDVVRMDPASERVVARIPVEGEQSNLFATEREIWVSFYHKDKLVRIDPRTNAPGAPISVPRAPGPIGEGFGSIWIAGQGEGEVGRVDPASGKVMVIPVHARPSAIASADGKIWVGAYNESTVFAIDPKTNQPVGRRINVADAPALMIESEGALWVSGAMSRSVSRIDF